MQREGALSLGSQGTSNLVLLCGWLCVGVLWEGSVWTFRDSSAVSLRELDHLEKDSSPGKG